MALDCLSGNMLCNEHIGFVNWFGSVCPIQIILSLAFSLAKDMLLAVGTAYMWLSLVKIKWCNHWLHDTCLLYTSDAADERSSVDLGGRRIIKKKKNNE